MDETFELSHEDHEDEELRRWSGSSMRRLPPRRFGRPRRSGGTATPPRRGRPRRRAWLFRPWVFRLPYPTMPWSFAAPSVEPEPEPEPAPDGRAAGPEEAVEGAAPSESEEELARRRALSASLTWWTKPLTIRQLVAIVFGKGNANSRRKLAGGGLYIVERGSVPIYVGEAESLARRWRSRLFPAWQIGLTDDAQIAVWFASIDRNTSEARKTVEHAIIRTLTKGRLGRALRNSQSTKEFDVDGPITITNLLPETYKTKGEFVVGQNLSEYDKAKNVLRLISKSRFEMESWLG